MPAPTPAVARQSLQGHYAGFASRFAAFVVDLVVLTGIYMLVLAAINFATSIVTGKDIAFSRGNLWVVIAYLVWGFIYFAHFWGLNGRTAGMALFGIQVLTCEGGDVSGRRALLGRRPDASAFVPAFRDALARRAARMARLS